MRVFLVAGAMLGLAVVFGGGGEARALSLQCTEYTEAADRDDCASREMGDIRALADYWRHEARQTPAEYAYYEAARQRCRESAYCVAQTYQTEISELQVKVEPAARWHD